MAPSKQQNPPPASTWQDEGLEFELTDFGEARRVLDNESISQFDVATAVSPAQWKRLRRATLPTDRALSGQAIDWLIGLPPNVRPEKLSSQFPRIVNSLAQAWHDPEHCEAVMSKLLGDERKGRAGFPAAVQAEIAALKDWMTALRGFNEPF